MTCVQGPDWEAFLDGRRIDIWADSGTMEPITQRDLFQIKFLGKRPKAYVAKVTSTRVERAKSYDDRVWQLRGTEYFRDSDGLTTRRLGSLKISEHDDSSRLVVDGFVVFSVLSDTRAVTSEDVGDGEWKNIIREWEGLDDEYLLTADKNSGRFPPLAHFLWTFIRGHFGKMSDEMEIGWLTVFYEKYLIWTGRLGIGSAKYEALHDNVDDVETVLRRRTVGWKFAISAEGNFAMVPSRSCRSDLVCVLFGADVPIVLRSRQESHPSYEFLGPAYVH